MIKEMKKENVLVSVCKSGKIVFWDLVKKDSSYNYNSLCDVSSADLSNNSELVALGSNEGVLRIINVFNVRRAKLVKYVKLFKNKPITNVCFSHNNQYIAASSNKARKIFFFSVI